MREIKFIGNTQTEFRTKWKDKLVPEIRDQGKETAKQLAIIKKIKSQPTPTNPLKKIPYNISLEQADKKEKVIRNQLKSRGMFDNTRNLNARSALNISGYSGTYWEEGREPRFDKNKNGKLYLTDDTNNRKRLEKLRKKNARKPWRNRIINTPKVPIRRDNKIATKIYNKIVSDAFDKTVVDGLGTYNQWNVETEAYKTLNKVNDRQPYSGSKNKRNILKKVSNTFYKVSARDRKSPKRLSKKILKTGVKRLGKKAVGLAALGAIGYGLYRKLRSDKGKKRGKYLR